MHVYPPDIYQKFAATLEQTQWLSRAELDRYQQNLLTRLVEFAYAHSPFYRERLQPLFAHGGNGPRLEAWGDIPLLRREDLSASLDRITPERVPAEAGEVQKLETSGSSGPPMRFHTCMLSHIAAEGMMYRHYSWHGFDFSASMASVRAYRNRPTFPGGKTEPMWSATKPGALHHTLDIREPVENIITWLGERAARYLMTFPSLLYDLAYHPDAGAIARLNIEKITGISESLTPHVRALVKERLGCEIAPIYACGEMGCIALQSPHDESYYACDEAVLVEILDESGNPVQPGATGQVVLTSLYNYATPFIRYEIGDFATLAEPAPSERTLKRLARVNGRPSNALRTGNGAYVWPHQVPMAELAAQLPSPRFQIRQNGKNSLELLVVAEPDARGGDHPQIAALLSKLMGSAVDVRITLVDDLPRTQGGKREIIIRTEGPE